MIVVITRTYIFLRAHTPRVLAAIGVMAAVAACGGSSAAPPAGTTSVPAPSAGSSAAPTANAGGGTAGALLNAPAGTAGSAQLSHAGAPKLTTAHAQAVSVGSGKISQASAGGITSARADTGFVTSGGAAPSPPSTSRTVAPTGTTTSIPKTTAPAQTAPTKTATTHAMQPSPAPKTIVHTVYRYRTKVHTVVRVRTVTKTLRPAVPAAAFLPSRHPALALTSFTVPGSNVGCAIGPGGVRCSIQRRVWAAPAQPARCRTSWGNTLSLRTHGPAKFVCGGSSALSPNAQVIPDGWDDKVGRVTCQVRGIGVDCFSKGYHGFIVSRTGYATY